MRRAMTRNLMATSAATLLTVLLAVPASAQGQDRGGRGGMQAGENMRGGDARGGGGEMRGGGNMRAAGSGEVRGGNQGEFRGSRNERGAQAGGRVRAQAATEGTIGRRDNLQRQTRGRSDARIRSDSNVRVRGDNNLRVRGDSNIRTGFRGDRWRGDDWRFRDRGTSVSVGLGFSDPYYAYGYDDSYYAYAAAEPYGYRRPFVSAHESYAASPGCTCAPGAYGAYATTYDSGWGWGSSWDRGGNW